MDAHITPIANRKVTEAALEEVRSDLAIARRDYLTLLEQGRPAAAAMAAAIKGFERREAALLEQLEALSTPEALRAELADVERRLGELYRAVDQFEARMVRRCRRGQALRIEQMVHDRAEHLGVHELERRRAELLGALRAVEA